MWKSIDESLKLPAIPERGYRALVALYDLCITGEGLSYLWSENLRFLKQIIPYVRVFARVAPKQKVSRSEEFSVF